MKLFVISDIHGSAECLKKALGFYEESGAGYILCLGDILYHGPRNPLPAGHDPKAAASMLNAYAGKIISCRGNCDAEVDQMVLDFPCLADYNLLADGDVRIFASHGHIYSPLRSDGNAAVPGSRQVPLSGINIMFYGHTHVQVLEKNAAGILVCNPGSLSLPKENSPAGFAIYEDGTVTLYDINGKEICSLSL